MSLPTTGVLFSGSTPAAAPGNQLCEPQTDGGTPAQIVSFVPRLATADLAGVVKPGAGLAVDGTGTLSVTAAGGSGGSGGGTAAGGAYLCVVPSGAKDGSNTQYTIPATVLAGTAYIYVRNGVVQPQLGASARYAVQGTQLTTNTPLQSDDWHEFYFVAGSGSSESGGGGSVTPLGSPTFIQGNHNYTTGTTITCAFPSSNSAGDCLIVDVIVQENFAGAGSLSISDSQGNTWHLAATNEDNTALVATWYALNCAGGANTVTVSYSTSTSHPGMAIAIHEYAAVKTVSAFDTSAYAFAPTTSSLPLSLSITTTVDGDLLHLYGSCVNAGTFSNGSSWTLREADTAGTAALTTFDALAGAAGSYSNTLNTSAGPVQIQGYLLALKSA